MNQFKGTKSKWLLNAFPKEKMSVMNKSKTKKICVSKVENYEESLANLLLISKAPEMLEMLNEMYQEWCETGICENKLDSYMSQIKKLIKEATEL